MVETTVQLGRYHQGKRRSKIEALKEAYEELKEMYGEEYHLRSDPRRRDNAHLHCDFVPLTKRKSIGEGA